MAPINTLDERFFIDFDFIAKLEARLPQSIVATFKTWWKTWESKVPKALRWFVYGMIAGLLVYAILQLVGFTAAGVSAGSLAALIQSSIGKVAAGSVFSALQSLGTASPFSFAGVGAAVGLVSEALVDMTYKTTVGGHRAYKN